MKLYTEEQVIKAIDLAKAGKTMKLMWSEIKEYDYSTDEIINQLTPIELPSDEDAAIAALKIAETLENRLTAIQEAFYLAGFTTCNQWLKEQILNQNK